MWTANAMAIYSGPPPPIARPESRLQKTSPNPSTAPSSPKLHQTSSKMSTVSAADFFGPALDRPPSPARLRQLNKQMKRASHLRRQNGHRAAASTSSSLTSINGEFAGWEQVLENLSLVRRSSIRSIDSNTPSRGRAESVPGFGKNMFYRRRRSKRESSANGSSSSSSSVYSTDSPAENTLAGPKESFMPALFSRRKPSRDDTAQRKFQISSPFNFQHVLHTNREDIPAIPPVHRLEQTPDLLTMRATGPGSTGAPSTFNILESRDFPFLSEANVEPANLPTTVPIGRPTLISRHTAPAGPHRLMRRIRSQDQLRAAPPVSSPPRPPRSPTQSTALQSFSPIPPRVSSRQGTCQEEEEEDDEQAIAKILERPKTSGGFRRPRPYSPNDSTEHLPPFPPFPSFHEPSTPKKHQTFDINGDRASPVRSLPIEEAWPLASPPMPSYETPLPDVPEEDEHFNAARRSRLSFASNMSSLRGSQSFPMMRPLGKSKRPVSGASETLGQLDMTAVQQVIVEGLEERHRFEFGIIEESWEDDIDYCYEHEAEATCDYQWERCSLDTARDSTILPMVTLAASEMQVPIGTARSSPGMLSVSGFDMPSLSPVNQASATFGHEAITPTSNPPMANNFSLPLVDKRNLRGSYASSFQEAQGFTLSPSLLIPGDFHQQMLLAGRHEYPEVDELMTHHYQNAYYDETTAHINKPIQWAQQRSSTSTTGTNSTSQSDSTAEHHVSTNSSRSSLTRHTTSSTSLNKMVGSWTESTEPVPATHLEDAKEDAMVVSQDTVPELTLFPPVPARKPSCHKPHASESFIRSDVSHSLRSFEAGQQRRSRARTTSMSSQAPPVGQYALFPRSYIKPSGDRI